MTDLSPEAQAVLDAFWRDLDFREDFTPANIGAALRVAAEQVGHWDAAEHLLSIAAELEGHGQA